MKAFKPLHAWFIITDGIDCSGKTTFIKEWNKMTDYSTWIVDRSTISVRAYAKKYSRLISSFYDLEKTLSQYPFTLFIRFIASKEDTIERQNRKNDGYDSNDYDNDMKLFQDSIIFSGYSKIIELNSSELSLNKEIENIINYIKKYESLYSKQEKLL